MNESMQLMREFRILIELLESKQFEGSQEELRRKMILYTQDLFNLFTSLEVGAALKELGK